MTILNRLDFFHKYDDDGVQRVHTNTGGFISIISILISTILLIYEVVLYFMGYMKNEIVVDTSTEKLLPISFDITFPRLECRFLALDLLDDGGNRLINIWQNVTKTDLDKNGKKAKNTQFNQQIGMEDFFGIKDPLLRMADKLTPFMNCLPCYEATSEVDICCNTCADLIRAFQKKQMDFANVFFYPQCRNVDFSNVFISQDRGGCNIKGSVNANRAEGYFEIGLIRPFRVNATGIDGIQSFFDNNLNLSHTINQLSFGEKSEVIKSPLNGFTTIQPYPPVYNYLIKIVPTTISQPPLSTISTFQYSVTHYSRRFTLDLHQTPGIYFYWEFSPQRIKLTKGREGISHLLTRICAVVGGFNAILILIESILSPFFLKRLKEGKVLDGSGLLGGGIGERVRVKKNSESNNNNNKNKNQTTVATNNSDNSKSLNSNPPSFPYSSPHSPPDPALLNNENSPSDSLLPPPTLSK